MLKLQKIAEILTRILAFIGVFVALLKGKNPINLLTYFIENDYEQFTHPT